MARKPEWGIRVVVRQPTEPVFNAHIHSTRQPATTLALDPREPPKTTGVARTSGIPGNPQKSKEIAVTAIRPEIGSSGSDGRRAGFFKKSGFLKKPAIRPSFPGDPISGRITVTGARFRRRLGRAGRSPVLAAQNGPLSTDSRQKLVARPTC